MRHCCAPSPSCGSSQPRPHKYVYMRHNVTYSVETHRNTGSTRAVSLDSATEVHSILRNQVDARSSPTELKRLAPD
eukprot:399240-Amphidinium_carterae.1